MLRRLVSRLRWACCLPMVAGCLPKSSPIPPAPNIAVSARVPRIVPVPETKEVQRRGGITIALAPTRFDTTSTAACSYGFAKTGFLMVIPAGVSRETHEKLIETRYDELAVSPGHLSFLLTVTNGMSRVFRGAGTLVQFTVDQRVQAAEQASYAEFIEALIPPRGEAQIRLRGPSLTALGEGATLGVLLYDVVVAMDAAGQVTKRENFEWFFRIEYESVSRQAVASRRELWVPRRALGGIVEVTPDGGQRINPTTRCVSTG